MGCSAGESTEYIDVNDLVGLKGQQFIHINARSILHKMSGFRYDFVKDSIGLMGITETWLNDRIPSNQVLLTNFNLIRNDRKTGRGGGTCFFIRSDIGYKISTVPCSNTNVEIQSITLTGEREHQQMKSIEAILIYRPPKGNEKVALRMIHDFMNSIPDLEKNKIIIMGDLNWNLLDKKSFGY